MRYHRGDVVARALAVLDRYGLADLTMRRLAADLGVRPSALYHHVADKQTLLALVADEVLARGDAVRPSVGPGEPWDAAVSRRCHALRDAVLAYRDGAEVVATARAFGLGGLGPERDLAALLRRAGLDDALARTAARTLLHFVLGHATDEQTHRQADSAGALPDGALPNDADADGALPGSDDFDAGLDLLLAGIGSRLPSPARPR